GPKPVAASWTQATECSANHAGGARARSTSSPTKYSVDNGGRSNAVPCGSMIVMASVYPASRSPAATENPATEPPIMMVLGIKLRSQHDSTIDDFHSVGWCIHGGR